MSAIREVTFYKIETKAGAALIMADNPDAATRKFRQAVKRPILRVTQVKELVCPCCKKVKPLKGWSLGFVTGLPLQCGPCHFASLNAPREGFQP